MMRGHPTKFALLICFVLVVITTIIVNIIIDFTCYPLTKVHINYHKLMCKDFCSNEWNIHPSHVELYTDGTSVCMCCDGNGASSFGSDWKAPYMDKYIATFEGGLSAYSGQNCIVENELSKK